MPLVSYYMYMHLLHPLSNQDCVLSLGETPTRLSGISHATPRRAQTSLGVVKRPGGFGQSWMLELRRVAQQSNMSNSGIRCCKIAVNCNWVGYTVRVMTNKCQFRKEDGNPCSDGWILCMPHDFFRVFKGENSGLVYPQFQWASLQR